MQGLTTDGTYAITYSAPVINSPTTLATAYTKISNTGAILPDTTVLGSGANDWACTKDNKTGLIWEVKTTDGGLRDWSQKYTNWFVDETGYGQATNSDYLTSAVNKQTMCGASNWRLPTNDKLKGLILCSDGQYTVLGKDTSGIVCTNNTNVVQPTINTTYFPNTQSFAFWTSSIITGFSNNAWYVNSYGGQNATYSKESSYYVRLVHDEKPIQNTTIADKTAADYLAGLKIAADKTAFDYLTTLKTTAEKTAADYLIGLKSTADKTASDYLTSLKSTADKTVADYLNTQKAAADKTAADYLAKLKAAADISNSTTSTTSSNGYVKISNTGTTLPDSAKLGTGANDWACTKDNKTGLVWEVKTDDVRLHDKVYSWYKPIGDNGGDAGYTVTTPTCSTKDNCSTYAFTNAVNVKGLCGKNDWRMPTVDELKTLVYCSDGKYDTDGSCTNYNSVSYPTINSTYFPNTDNWYWSSSPNAYLSGYAWGVDFNYGASDVDNKDHLNFVRLVR